MEGCTQHTMGRRSVVEEGEWVVGGVSQSRKHHKELGQKRTEVPVWR